MNYGDIPFKKVKLSHCAVYFISVFLCVLVFAGIVAFFLSEQSSLNTGSPFATLTTSSSSPQSSTVRITPTIIPTTLTPTAQNIEILQDILTNYHNTHTYYGPDIYVCGDMASDVWNMVETKGINATLEVGNIETEVSSIREANHVWVLAEISPDNWIALETTGGFLVCNNSEICPVNNKLYYRGWNFDNPGELKEGIAKQRHPCPDGYVFGSDQLCHPACGGSYYSTGDNICVNGRCIGCDTGYTMGGDLQCHEECPAGSGRYCEYGASSTSSTPCIITGRWTETEYQGITSIRSVYSDISQQ